MNKKAKSKIFHYNFFLKNRRGVSGIITMLIIVALVLVATGGVWVVVKNILETSSEEVEISSSRLFQKCSDLGYEKMFEGWNCDGEIIYAGGEKCCTGDAKSDKELLESLGAISWWRFEGDATDEVGENNGVIVGDVQFIEDSERGMIASFDGVEDYVNCGNDESLQIGGNAKSFTIGTWAKRNVNNPNMFIVGQGLGSSNSGLHFGYRYTNKFSLAFYANDLDVPTLYQDAGEWHHWIGTYNGMTNERCIYRDGILEICATAPEDYLGSGNLYVGQSLGSYFNGIIDEVMIFNRSLSEEEIKTLYELELG